MKQVDLNADALVATIEVLWGPKMIPVADRVYNVLDRMSKQSHAIGLEKGRKEGREHASAPSALQNPLPTPPEDLYRDEMLKQQAYKEACRQDAIRLGQEELAKAYHDPYAGYAEPKPLTCMYGKGHTAMCSMFPSCGCIA